MLGDNEFKSCTTCKYYCPADDFTTCSSKELCQNFQYWEEGRVESCFNCVNSECTSGEYPCDVCDGDKYIDIRKVKEQSSEPETSCHRCINMGKAFDSTSNDTPCDTCEGYTNFEQDAKQVVFQTQVGGSHYKNPNVPAGFPDPAEFCIMHGLGGAETAVIKYVFRHSRKDGVKDLKKAKQYLEFLAACRYNEII